MAPFGAFERDRVGDFVGEVAVGGFADVVPGDGVLTESAPRLFFELEPEPFRDALLDPAYQDGGGVRAGYVDRLVGREQRDTGEGEFFFEFQGVERVAAGSFDVFADDGGEPGRGLRASVSRSASPPSRGRPLVVAGVWGLGLAWARGWPPRRLAVAALWCLPMLVVSAASYAAWRGGGLHTAATAPYRQWLDSWHAVGRGNLVEAAAIIAPSAVPLGLLLGAAVWRSRIGLMEAGSAGWSPAAPVVFDERQWRRAARTAAQRARAPGGVPLLSARGNPNLGAPCVGGGLAGRRCDRGGAVARCAERNADDPAWLPAVVLGEV